jgi:predicted nucleotidyltransferase
MTATLSKLKPDTKRILDIALEKILSVGNPAKVILFGSYARGDENEDSDLDICIIENEQEITEINTTKYYKALFRLNHAKDIIVRSLKEFEANKTIINTLEYDVYKEGILLYERKL